MVGLTCDERHHAYTKSMRLLLSLLLHPIMHCNMILKVSEHHIKNELYEIFVIRLTSLVLTLFTPEA